MATFKKLTWTTEDPKEMMLARVKIFGNDYLGFRLMECTDGLIRLIDGQKQSREDRYSIVVNSIEEGKREAQLLYERYCAEIVINICE